LLGEFYFQFYRWLWESDALSVPLFWCSFPWIASWKTGRPEWGASLYILWKTLFLLVWILRFVFRLSCCYRLFSVLAVSLWILLDSFMTVCTSRLSVLGEPSSVFIGVRLLCCSWVLP
jgi:hypothetical protein